MRTRTSALAAVRGGGRPVSRRPMHAADSPRSATVWARREGICIEVSFRPFERRADADLPSVDVCSFARAYRHRRGGMTSAAGGGMSTRRGRDTGNGPAWCRRGARLARIAAAARVLTSFPTHGDRPSRALCPRRGSHRYTTRGADASCAAAVLSSGDGWVRGSAAQLREICETDVSTESSLLAGTSTNLRDSCRFPRANLV